MPPAEPAEQRRRDRQARFEDFNSRVTEVAVVGLLVFVGVCLLVVVVVGIGSSGVLNPFGPYAGGEVDGNEPPVREAVEASPLPPPEPMPDLWSCSYMPTMNDNWHDDVVCSRGAERFRPNLLPGEFVTPDEMKRAAADYEETLNQ